MTSNVTAQNWKSNYTAGSIGIDHGNKVKIDHEGNILLQGYASEGAVFGNTVLHYSGNFVAKYDTSGNVSWIIPAGEGLQLTAMNRQTNGGIEVDAEGNIYVTGNFSDTCHVGDSILTGNSSDYNIFLSRINPDGKVAWIKYITNKSVSTGIALDSSGNILICGYTEGVSTFSGVIVTPFGTQNNRDIIFAKYDSTGQFRWVRQCGGSGFYADRAFAIACDGEDNVIVTGHIRSDASFGGYTLLSTAPSQSYYNGFITKYDKSGDAQWVTYCGYSGTGLGILPNGDIYAAGYTSPGHNGFDSLLSVQGSKVFVARLNSSGEYLWARSHTGGGSGMSDLAADPTGNCYITGHFTGTVFFATDTLYGNTSDPAWNTKMFLVKYDSIGTEQWAKSGGGDIGSHTWGFGLATRDTCEMVVCGSFQSPPDVILEDTLTGFGNYDIFFSRFSGGCSNTPTATSEHQLSRNDKEIQVFPVPACKSITIILPSDAAHELVIYDGYGRNLVKCIIRDNSSHLDVSMWASGLYCITLRNIKTGLISQRKFVKQ